MSLKSNIQPLLLLALLFVIGGCGNKGPAVDYSTAPSISFVAGPKPVEDGLSQFHPKDGSGDTIQKKIAEKDCELLQPNGYDDGLIYFKIAPSFKKALAMNLNVTVEYYDVERSSFWIEYDGWDEHNDKAGANTPSVERKQLAGNPTVWLKAVFSLPKARLRNRLNDGADFCIRADHAHLLIHSVTVERMEVKE